MNVRPLAPVDRAALHALIRSVPNFTPDEVAVAIELVDEALDDPATSYRVAVAAEDDAPGARLLGYVCWGLTPMTETTVDLYWIAVDPTRQGAGIGRSLHAWLLDTLRAQGIRLVRVETSSKDDYDGTVAFYERLGYRTVSRVEGFYREGDDLITMFFDVAG